MPQVAADAAPKQVTKQATLVQCNSHKHIDREARCTPVVPLLLVPPGSARAAGLTSADASDLRTTQLVARMMRAVVMLVGVAVPPHAASAATKSTTPC
jgi:hypothetical protein